MHIHRKIPLSLSLIVGFMFILSASSLLWAGNPKSLEEAIADKVKTRRQNPKALIDTRDFVGHYDDAAIVAQAIDLRNDPNRPVKQFGIQLLSAVGRKSDKPDIRKKVVKAFVEGLNDQYVYENCARLLKGYQRADFSQESKTGLKQHFDEVISKGSRDRHARDIILLIGVADMQTEMDSLQAIIDNVTEPLKITDIRKPWHRRAFAALKAKARMGDKNAIQRCISLVDSVSDEDFKVLKLLNDISYIRQPEGIDYIKRFLYSDKKQSSGGPDTMVYPYSYYAAEYLEKLIVGFPGKLDVWPIYRKKRGIGLGFRDKWPLFSSYYGEYCKQWLEEQTSIQIIR